ncbi:MAG: hypothetical protein ACYTF5_21365 [Planctomycetota bacterium]|jgi:hypothetical protein
MTASPSPHAVAADETRLVVDLRAERGGPVLATEPVRSGDLQEAVGEIWWRGYARRGAFAADVHAMEVSLQPVMRETAEVAGEVAGKADGKTDGKTAGNEDAEPVNQRPCPGFVLSPVAQRGATELLRRGVLRETDTFYYELRAVGPAPSGPRPIQRSVSTKGTVLSRSRDTSFEVLPLAALMECSRPVGTTVPGDHQLFYTETALQRAESIARRGEQLEPAVESGGVLMGLLCWCPVAGDAFVVVVDALEAQDASQHEFSLSFSGKTWLRLQAVLRARRAQPGEGALRILGQTHGHPFSAGEPCAACPQTPDCPKHTALLSEDDRRWSRAVFAGQPWQVGHLWGINARGEPTANVYGLSGGRLEPRGYRVIADADLKRIRQAPTTGDAS